MLFWKGFKGKIWKIHQGVDMDGIGGPTPDQSIYGIAQQLVLKVALGT